MVTRVLLDMIISFRVSFIHYVIILRVSYSIPHLEEFLKWLLFILIVLWKIFLRNYLKQGTYIINVGMHIILVSTARSRFRCRSLRHSLGNTSMHINEFSNILFRLPLRFLWYQPINLSLKLWTLRRFYLAICAIGEKVAAFSRFCLTNCHSQWLLMTFWQFFPSWNTK